MDRDFWTTKGSGTLDGVGEMSCNNFSRLEQKRSQQLFLDSSEIELFPNKKQAVEVPNHTSFSGLLTSNTSQWENALSFQPVTGHFNERLYDPETARNINFDHRNDSSVGIGTMNLERKFLEDPFESASSFDPRSGLNYTGNRKIKVSQVNDSVDYMPSALEHVCASGDDDTMSLSHAYSKAGDASLTMGLSFDKKDENVISMIDTFNIQDDSCISMGQSYNEDDCHISISQAYKMNNNSIPSGYSLNKDNTNVMAMMDKDVILMSHTFKECDNVIPVGQSFSKDDNNITSIGQIFNQGIDDTQCIGQTDNNSYENLIILGHACNKMSNRGLPMDLSVSTSESNIISFGGLNDYEDGSPSDRLVCNYDLLMGQSSVQNSEALNQTQLIDSSADVLASDGQIISHDDSSLNKKVKQKANKKAPPNNFPSNVRSLLSTGIFDGVPVKYVALSREELSGIIKGSGYLCGCHMCNLSKVINAHEFEHHAGYKTKHPNNHIYFDNGKTVYGIVQELRSTPQNSLYEVIQTISGSPINQKSFCLWKESFIAATRELQRIFGKEEGKQLQ